MARTSPAPRAFTDRRHGWDGREGCGRRWRLSGAARLCSQAAVSVLLRQRVSRVDRLQSVLCDAEITHCLLSAGVRLEVDAEAVPPSEQMRHWHRCLHAALPPAPMHHRERERVLAEVEVRIGLDQKL